MKIYISILFTVFSFYSYSQTYQPIDTSNYEVEKRLIKDYEIINKSNYKKLKKEYKGKLRKEIISIYESKHKEFLKNIKKKRFIFDVRFTSYIDSLTNVFIKHNPKLSSNNLKLYISKNPTINAMSIGEGIIILNIGLFKYLKNEAQLASVISHEIAHDDLFHTKNSIKNRALLQTSKEKKNQARKIKKQRYKTYDKAFKIMKDLLYSNVKTKRFHEKQADSIGYLLYKKSNFSRIDYVNAFKILGQYDSLPEIKLDTTIYRRFFNLPKQPFKKEWLDMEEFSSYDYSNYKEKINKDSLKTHPEIKERILKLKHDFSELNSNKESSKPSKRFKELQEIALQEDLGNLFYLEKYGQSIKLALYKLSIKPKDKYVKMWLGKNFLALYKAKKKYQLNRHIERIKPQEQSKNYQQFLNFIWNLNLDELKTIGDYYVKSIENKG